MDIDIDIDRLKKTMIIMMTIIINDPPLFIVCLGVHTVYINNQKLNQRSKEAKKQKSREAEKQRSKEAEKQSKARNQELKRN